MPLRLDLQNYLEPYRGSLQERDPVWRHNVFRATREIADEASRALSRAAGGGHTYSIVTGTRIDIRTLREEAENAPVDLKPGLLYGKSSRVSQKGVRYAIVPFRKRTPGRGRGGLYTLPSDVYRAAARGKVILPGTEMGERFRRTGYGGEEWKSGPFANLTRYPRGTRSSVYYTFRTVSENSPPLSWIRPPFLAKSEVTDAVESYMGTLIPGMIRDRLGDPSFGSRVQEEEEEEF